MDKEILINLIISKGFGGSHRFAIDMTNRGLATFTGNQHNKDWSWNKDGLEALPIEELNGLAFQHPSTVTMTMNGITCVNGIPLSPTQLDNLHQYLGNEITKEIDNMLLEGIRNVKTTS